VGNPIKVAVSANPGNSGIENHVAAGVRQAAQLLSAAGYAVEEVEPPAIAEATDLWAQLVIVLPTKVSFW
jgi:amidase